MEQQAEVAAMDAACSTTENQDVQASASDEDALAASNDVSNAAEASPSEELWVRKWDDASGSLYYFNLRTQKSSWEQPQAYKAVFMSDPMDMDSGRAPETVESAIDPNDEQLRLQQQQEQQNSASVAIQSLYRGWKGRKRVKEARKWTEQFDPTTAQKYYYNSETGESQWEKPADFLTGVKDERSARAVKIQSVYRAKKARDRVKQLADEEDEEEELMEQQMLDEAEALAQKELAATVADESSPRVVWCEYFDPRSGKYYYRHVATNAITWEKPETYVSSWAKGSKRDLAALSIQCAARKRIATNDVEAKRAKLRALTDPAAMQLKLGELKQVSVEIQAEIDARALVSAEEEQQFPHLINLLSGWRESLESIKNHITSLENQGEDILLAEGVASRVAQAERFHKALAEMRSECLTVLRSILLMNSYFVDLDVHRINIACTTFAKWKLHEVCALRDSRLVEIIQGSDISQILDKAEALLRRAMGLTDFNSASTSSDGKRYEDWHPSVAAALIGVSEMKERLTQKTQLLRGYRSAEARKREISQMAEEDLLASRLAQLRRRRVNDEIDHAAFLVKCQEYWKKGLNQREEDLHAAVALESSKLHIRSKTQEAPHADPTSDPNNHDNKFKLSIWEATKEGLSVDDVRAMVFAEMQKARRLGYDFLVKTARSDLGETLIQIACWWGHAHLVRFFLEEGAQIDGVDSTCNRFSLLHEAARRGHSHVIRILLDHGLSCNLTDSTGDTPFHWAARKNNYSAVLTLLGVYSSDRDKTAADAIIKTVRYKNYRGKMASALAKGERVRAALKAAEEGRLPPLRRPRTGDSKSTATGFSRRMTEVGHRDRTRGISPKKGKTMAMLSKSTKHGSTLDIDELVSRSTMLAISAPEKMEQLITVFSQRLQPQALQRLSVADILQDASAAALMREEIPSLDTFHVGKQQKPCFGRILKFLHLHEPTGLEKDEEHKRAAVRYLALRTMLQQCGDIKISNIQEACLDKVLRWFEATEANALTSSTGSTPILPPRMSPKKTSLAPNQLLDKCASETSFLPAKTSTSNATVAAKLEKYKMPDLRASHIRRIAELRSRGADVSEASLPIEENNNIDSKREESEDSRRQAVQDRMIEATFKLYRPETDAEREMNLLWLRRRQEDETTRMKDEEVQQRVQKWSMDRSRDESENLRKRESTSASEEEDDESATEDSAMRRQKTFRHEIRHQMKLQSYHVPCYYAGGGDHTATTGNFKPQKAHPRGTIPVQPLPADPELRCLQEASEMRRVFALPIDKALQKPAPPPITTREAEREVSSSRKSGRSETSKPRRRSRSSKGKRAPTSARSGAAVLPRSAPTYTFSEPPVTASTSDLRQSQLEELEKIRRLFEENHLTLSPQALERGLLVPEDRPLLESITNLPVAGSRLLINPLTRRAKTAKPRKKLSAKKKKGRKAKKSAGKSTKSPKSSRPSKK
ncbi:uncharacterized protein IUM83_06509 [Phytophthora cinnamomi]|uniref:uncharacterized protein n=1 Tax=Phytophthora cinnamomi TaxID=4785 RepID=UPI00355A889F|nr:hypothetical protein IUM83_06509 [Phytophthora cinnamomi]